MYSVVTELDSILDLLIHRLDLSALYYTHLCVGVQEAINTPDTDCPDNALLYDTEMQAVNYSFMFKYKPQDYFYFQKYSPVKGFRSSMGIGRF